MPFFHEVEVLPADVDRLGHASNQGYLRWVLDAGLAHSTALGLDENAYFARGQAWVVRKHELTYLRPAFAGEKLRIETRGPTTLAAESGRGGRVRGPAR